MFRVPYYMPEFNSGLQLVNLQNGGPASHMGIQAAQPRTYPTILASVKSGLGAMPRQIIGPTDASTANNYSNPITVNNLIIDGLMKNPRGG